MPTTIHKDLKDIGIDPAKLKTQRGLRSLASVGRSVGVSRQQVWNYENGFAHPSANTIAKMCRLYDCDISDLTT